MLKPEICRSGLRTSSITIAEDPLYSVKHR